MCGQLRIQRLYREGKKIVVWPLRITYLSLPHTDGAKTEVVIWAPKALFKHAVDRNRLRRQMREAYRLNKTPIEMLGWQIAFNYMDKQQHPYSTIEHAMRKAIRKIEAISQTQDEKVD